jgi:hypothetical protein
MENKEKPIAKIVDISKLKIRAFALSEEQAEKYSINLGDVLTIEVKAIVVNRADSGENLFAYTNVFEVDKPVAYLTGVKKYEEILQERNAEEQKQMQETAAIKARMANQKVI